MDQVTHILRLSSILFLFLLYKNASSAAGKLYGVLPPARREQVSNNTDGLKTYIIHVSEPPASPSSTSFGDRDKWYQSFLPTSLGEPNRLIYSYKSIASGFAARLTDQELTQVKSKLGFVHAYPDRILRLQTTHTPAFLGLHRHGPGIWNDSNFGRGVIIGVLDTGASPDHPSFGDGGMPPPPAKWKGECEFSSFSCNNKLLGARNFVRGSTAANGPYDEEGHGTHTASTAAGTFVKNANVDGLANGTAAGVAPFAHLAIYRVCSAGVCAESDVLAGMDSAVADGVDVLSLSLATRSLEPFYNNVIAIGALGAVEKGIFVSCAAGNDGPAASSVRNEAPWLLTVGATTTDRSIRTTVRLGSGDSFDGESAYQPSGGPRSTLQLPLVYPGLNDSNAALCSNGSLDRMNLKGLAVLCDDGDVDWVTKGVNVKKAGGAAMIIANDESEGFITMANMHVLPASHVGYSDGLSIKSYLRSDPAPTASIGYKGTVFGTKPAPAAAGFSSRGPSQADPNILKPDIAGPGVNILAAWPVEVGPANAATRFNILSGTSMAAPHLSGVAALLKSLHPSWSPAAIKSAIMTTADTNANDGKVIPDENLRFADFFAIGAGQVNPVRASNPGLVYDIEPSSYIGYLCGLGYTSRQVSTVAGRSIDCSRTRTISGSELNYPSISVALSTSNSNVVAVKRTVTNVGPARSAYDVSIAQPLGATVSVKPDRLSFSKAGEKVQFTVSFTADKNSSSLPSPYSEAFLTWVSSDRKITVTSPIMAVFS